MSGLAGGWRTGDVVESQVAHGNVKIGDQGVVMGPSTNAAAKDAAERVNVDFGIGKGRFNFGPRHIQDVPLPGGWMKRDRVLSRVKHDSIERGDQGVVMGPCSTVVVKDAALRVSVDFGVSKGRVDFLTSEIVGVPLAGGWMKFDRVVAKVAHRNVKIGDQGVVMGPSDSGAVKAAAMRVNVDFGVGKGRFNFGSYQIEDVPLPGGWMKRDQVLSRIKHNGIERGDLGVVMGPCSNAAANDAAMRVHVDFGVCKGRADFLVSSEIEVVPLPDGRMTVDRVLSEIKHDGRQSALRSVFGPRQEEEKTGEVTSAQKRLLALRERIAARESELRARPDMVDLLVSSEIEAVPLPDERMTVDRALPEIKHDGRQSALGSVLSPRQEEEKKEEAQKRLLALRERIAARELQEEEKKKESQKRLLALRERIAAREFGKRARLGGA